MRGSSISSGDTWKRRGVWRKRDEIWRRRWTHSIEERWLRRRWWARPCRAAHNSPSRRTRTRKSKSAFLRSYLPLCLLSPRASEFSVYILNSSWTEFSRDNQRLLVKWHTYIKPPPQATDIHSAGQSLQIWLDGGRRSWMWLMRLCYLARSHVGSETDTWTDWGWHCVPRHSRRGHSLHDTAWCLCLCALTCQTASQAGALLFTYNWYYRCSHTMSHRWYSDISLVTNNFCWLNYICTKFTYAVWSLKLALKIHKDKAGLMMKSKEIKSLDPTPFTIIDFTINSSLY